MHLYGQPVEMDAIIKWPKNTATYLFLKTLPRRLVQNIQVIKPREIEEIAEFLVFLGNKIITCGEGGMVTTQNDELAAKCRLYRGQGMDLNNRYWFPVVGYNYRITNIQAAIGLAQLEKFPKC